MKGRILCACFLFAGALLVQPNVRARTSSLQPCETSDGGVTYRAPENYGDGGVVTAYDSATGEKLWSQRVYGIEFSGGIEEDCEWVRIERLSVTNGILFVENSRNHVFELDLRTRRVKSRNDGMLAVEVPDVLGHPPVSGLRAGFRNGAFREIIVECVLLRSPKGTSARFAKDRLREADLLKTEGVEILSHPVVLIRNDEQCDFRSVVDCPVQYLDKLNVVSTNGVEKYVQAQFSETAEMIGVGTSFQCHASFVYPDRETVRLQVYFVYRGRPRGEKTVWGGQTSDAPGQVLCLSTPSFPSYEFNLGEIKLRRGEYRWLGSLPSVDAGTDDVSLFIKWVPVNDNGENEGNGHK